MAGMRKKAFVLWALFIVLCLAACGRQESSTGQEEAAVTENDVQQNSTSAAEDDQAPDSVPVQAMASGPEESSLSAEEAAAASERLEHDWRTEEWQIGENVGREHNLYAAEYFSGLESETQEEYINRYTDYKVWGHRIYALDKYCTASDGAEEYFYYMNYYDSFTGEIRHLPLELPWPEEYAYGEITLADFDIQSEDEWVFFWWVYSEEGHETLAYLATRLNAEGELLSQVDLFPAVRTYGDRIRISDICIDQRGYYHMSLTNEVGEGIDAIGQFLDHVYILNPEGELAGELGTTVKYPGFAMKTPDGDPVFCWFDGVDKYKLMYYDTELQEQKVVLKLNEGIWNSKWRGMLTEDGYLYFLDKTTGINRCDLYTGDRDYCLRYSMLGLGDMPYYVYMIPGPDGEPIMIDTLEGEAVICRLSQEKPEEDPLRLVSFTGNCTLLESQAVLFSKQDLEHPVYVESPEGDEEDYRARMMAELVAGNGADIYYVSAADMQILYDKGVLADLSEILSPETLDAVYSGVLDGGTIDGQRVGIVPEARANTMLVSDRYWTEDSWNLEELLDLIDAHPELSYPIVQPGAYMDGYKILQQLLFYDLDGTPFLDLEKGTSDFENPLFIRVLELAKRYQEQKIVVSISEDMTEELIATGDYAAIVLNLWDFPSFNNSMAQLGESCHTVGFPTETGAGSYWQTDYYLVVSRNAKYPELVHGYLEYLLSEESQDKTLNPVRRGLLGEHIVTVSWDTTYPQQYSTGNGNYYPLETKSDGSIWQEEYETVLDQCVMVTKDTEYIQEIIEEEIGDFFAGIRDEKAVAGLIQNRVQLYLNERGTVQEAPQKGQSGVHGKQ